MSCLSQTQKQSVFDAVFGYVTGCPAVAINSAIDMTVDDYIRDIGGIIFRDVIKPCEQWSFYVDAPLGGRANGIRKIVFNGRQLNADEFVFVQHEDGASEVKLCSPRIVRVSGAQNDFHITGTWIPTSRTNQLPSAWFDANFDGLRNGTLVNIFSQIGKSWGNPAMAQKFQGDYTANVYVALRDLHETDNRGGQLNVFDPTSDWTCGAFV